MVLSADHVAILEREGYSKERFTPGSIKPQTNLGVRLGMTESQVRRILGRPARSGWSKELQARELVYRREEKWSKKKREERHADGMTWTNSYRFRKGRLFYIELAQDLEGGA